MNLPNGLIDGYWTARGWCWFAIAAGTLRQQVASLDSSSSHFKPKQCGCWRRLAHADWQTWAMKIEGNSGCFLK